MVIVVDVIDAWRPGRNGEDGWKGTAFNYHIPNMMLLYLYISKHPSLPFNTHYTYSIGGDFTIILNSNHMHQLSDNDQKVKYLY